MGISDIIEFIYNNNILVHNLVKKYKIPVALNHYEDSGIMGQLNYYSKSIDNILEEVIFEIHINNDTIVSYAARILSLLDIFPKSIGYNNILKDIITLVVENTIIHELRHFQQKISGYITNNIDILYIYEADAIQYAYDNRLYSVIENKSLVDSVYTILKYDSISEIELSINDYNTAFSNIKLIYDMQYNK